MAPLGCLLGLFASKKGFSLLRYENFYHLNVPPPEILGECNPCPKHAICIRTTHYLVLGLSRTRGVR